MRGSSATMAPRWPPSASQAACWTASRTVSSTDEPWFFWPVSRLRRRSTHRAEACPLRNSFIWLSMPDEPLTIEKKPVTGAYISARCWSPPENTRW